MKHMIAPCMAAMIALLSFCSLNSCQKITLEETPLQDLSASKNVENVSKPASSADPHFNLEVILRGDGPRFGHIKFRQNNDMEKIIDLAVWVKGLDPNKSYQLQRAVDAINMVDGECTSNTWLTLGKGLDPFSIETDDKGTGTADLWRSVSAIPSGSYFDIHFRVVEENTSVVVLTSGCYEYTVR